MPLTNAQHKDRTTPGSSGSTNPWSELSPPSRSQSEEREATIQNNMDDRATIGTRSSEDKLSPENTKSICTTSESQIASKASGNKDDQQTIGDAANTEPKANAEKSKKSEIAINSSTPTKGAARKLNPPKAKKVSKPKKKPSSNESSENSSSSEDLDVAQAKAGKNKDAETRCKKSLTADRKRTPPKKKSETIIDSDDDSTTSEDEKQKKRQVKAKKARVKANAKAKSAKETADPSESDDESSEAEEDIDTTEPKFGETSIIDSVFDASISNQSLAQFTAVRLRDVTFERKPEAGLKVKYVPNKTKKKIVEEATSGEKIKKGSKAECARVDRIYSSEHHRFVIQPSTEDKKSGQFDGYAFNIVRQFDFGNKYLYTQLHILSDALKTAIVHVMGDVKGISLEEETPKINPNEVFLHLEELRAYLKGLKAKIKAKKQKARAEAKVEELKLIRKHLKVLVEYLDEDYDETKKSLFPLIKSGKITFDLVWALFKSNEIVYTHTYGHEDESRAAKIEYVSKTSSVMEGERYVVEVRFLDYDGTRFGMSKATFDIPEFKGPRKISSLSVYPLAHHKDSEGLKTQLIERGKKFVALAGMQYRFHKGIAFHKKDRKVIKVNVNGRIMIDPATFRRLRPNYQFSSIDREDPDLLSDSEGEGDIEEINENSSSSDDDQSQSDPLKDDSDTRTEKEMKKFRKSHKKKLVQDPEDPEVYQVLWVNIDENVPEPLEPLLRQSGQEESTTQKFTDEDYLIASPVALGFSFGEKMWLEFALSSIHEIQWNEGAFDSLIIPEDQKTVVRALVESHAFEAKKNIDDVIQGKGKGLVAVLHGPPGTGKTLTAEGIAELLRKPLYAVSVGELGIKGGDVERNLTQILDVAHTWGALLLLDEADVFLEQRTNYDVGRNALVSIFLRMLEYFQGILFLTTNRVTVFDPAFASRVHIGLRYGELSVKARKQVWRMFLDKVKDLEDVSVEEIGDEEYKRLGGFELNGREIKNAVRTAQSVALINKETLGMKHLLQVLLVGEVFAKDLKGPGYEEAMKFYM